MSPFVGPDAGRDGSFEAFVASSSTRLLRSAYLLCGDYELAEDLLQITMSQTARRWSSARAAPLAYAQRVLVNAGRDRARRQRRRVSEVVLDAADGASPERPPTRDHAELIADRDAVVHALTMLPQRQREVIVLRFYADLSVTDTAAAIGASEGTVMSYTSRALTRLRQLLGENDDNAKPPAEQEVEHGHR